MEYGKKGNEISIFAQVRLLSFEQVENVKLLAIVELCIIFCVFAEDVKSKYPSEYFTAGEQTSPSGLLNVNSQDRNNRGAILEEESESRSSHMDESFVHVDDHRQMDMAYGNPSRFHLVSVINPQTGISIFKHYNSTEEMNSSAIYRLFLCRRAKLKKRRERELTLF